MPLALHCTSRDYDNDVAAGRVPPHVAINPSDWRELPHNYFRGYDFATPRHAVMARCGSRIPATVNTSDLPFTFREAEWTFGRDGLSGMLNTLTPLVDKVQYRRRLGRLDAYLVQHLVKDFYAQRKWGSGACFFVPFRERYYTWSSENVSTVVICAWAGNLWVLHVSRLVLSDYLTMALSTHASLTSIFKDQEPPPESGMYFHQLSRFCSYLLLHRAFRYAHVLSSGVAVLPPKSISSRLLLANQYISDLSYPMIVECGYHMWPTWIENYIFFLIRSFRTWRVYITHPAAWSEGFMNVVKLLAHPFHKRPVGYSVLWQQYGKRALPWLMDSLTLTESAMCDFQRLYMNDPKDFLAMYALQRL